MITPLIFLPIVFMAALGYVNSSSDPPVYIDGTSLVPGHSHIKLNCVTTDEHGNGQVEWRFSRNGTVFEKLQDEEDRLRIVGTVLWFQSVMRKDVGVYQCCLMGGASCATKPLFVVSTDMDKKIKCVEDFTCEKATFDVRPNESFALTVHHGPLPAISDIKKPITPSRRLDEYQEIPLCAHFKHCDEHRNSTSYQVWNATMQDSGMVNVHIGYGGSHHPSYPIYVLIEGKPQITMSDYHVIIANGTTGTVNLLCKGQAHPKPTYTFYYQPCPTMGLDDASCHESEWIMIDHQQFTQFNHSIDSEAMVPSWNVSAPGMVQCNATNRQGDASATSYVYLRNFEEDMQFKLVSPTDEVLYGENIVIACAVDIYNFTRNVTISHSIKNSFYHASSTTTQDRYAWKTTYENHVSRQTFTRNAEFICEAIDKHGDSWSRKLQFTIYDPIDPHATEGNTVRQISLAANKSTTLVCNIDGAPPPKFTWFKNNDLHSWRNNAITVMLEEGEATADYVCIGWSKLGKANITWHIVQENTFEVIHVVGMGTVGICVLVLLVVGIMLVRENRHLRARLDDDSHSHSLPEMEERLVYQRS